MSRKYLLLGMVLGILAGCTFVLLNSCSGRVEGVSEAGTKVDKMEISGGNVYSTAAGITQVRAGDSIVSEISKTVRNDTAGISVMNVSNRGNSGKSTYSNSDKRSTGNTVTNSPSVSNNVRGEMKKEDINSVVKAVSGFKTTGDTVDYKTIDNGYRNKFLYYFSSLVNAEESVDAWIEEVKINTIVSQAKFVPDYNSVYIDSNYYTRVRGSSYIKYAADTNPEYLNEKGLSSGIWYRREEELLFYIAVDNQKWERSEWVFCKGYIVTNWREE